MKNNLIVCLFIIATVLTACQGAAQPEQGNPVSTNQISVNQVSENDSSSSGNAVSQNITDVDCVLEEIPDEITETEVTSDVEVGENTPEDDVTYEYLDVTINSYREQLQNEVLAYDLINLETTEYPLLTEAISSFNSNEIAETEDASEAMQEVIEYWRESRADAEEREQNRIVHERTVRIHIQRQDSMVLSVLKKCYRYMNGAHGNTWYESTNLNTQTGEEIPIDSVITDFSNLSTILEAELQEKYPYLENMSMAERIENYIIVDDSGYDYSLAWTLEYNGVRFFFGHYEATGTYALGSQFVTLLYSEYPELLNPMYFENVQDDFVINFDFFYCYDADLNEDGITEYITVSPCFECTDSTNSVCDEHYIVQVDDVVCWQEGNGYYLNTFLVRDGEQQYLYVQHTEDIKFISVFEISDESVSLVGELEGEIEQFSNSSFFQIRQAVDLLGSFNVIMDCCIDDNGMPVAIQDRYTIVDEFVLTSTAEIEAELIDENGNLLGISYMFPVATEFTLNVTDGENYVEATTSDGQRCILYVESGTTTMVNGYDAVTVFDLE